MNALPVQFITARRRCHGSSARPYAGCAARRRQRDRTAYSSVSLSVAAVAEGNPQPLLLVVSSSLLASMPAAKPAA